MSCNLIEFLRIFCNELEAILSRISALCPGCQTFISKKHLKEFANHIHLLKNRTVVPKLFLIAYHLWVPSPRTTFLQVNWIFQILFDQKFGNNFVWKNKTAVDLPGWSSRRLLQYFINLNSAPRPLLRTRLVDHKCPCTEWSSIRYWEHSRAH